MLGAHTLTKVLYTAFKRPPFRIQETGWGEFDMIISLLAVDKGGEHTIGHDLNFQNERYESKHTIVSLSAQAQVASIIRLR